MIANANKLNIIVFIWGLSMLLIACKIIAYHTMSLCQVLAWYEVSPGIWKLLSSKARRRYREFITLQNALEANPAYASSLKGETVLVYYIFTHSAGYYLFRPHRMHEMQLIANDDDVMWCTCLSVVRLHPAKCLNGSRSCFRRRLFWIQ